MLVKPAAEIQAALNLWLADQPDSVEVKGISLSELGEDVACLITYKTTSGLRRSSGHSNWDRNGDN